MSDICIRISPLGKGTEEGEKKQTLLPFPYVSKLSDQVVCTSGS